MVYILYGHDSFSLQERLNEIKGSLGEGEFTALNTQVLDAADLTADHFASICQTIPFMASKRLVIVHGLLSRFEPAPGQSRFVASAQQSLEEAKPSESGDDTSTESGRRQGTRDKSRESRKDWASFAQVIRNLPETTLLVLVDEEVRKNNPLLANLSQLARVEVFSPLKENELSTWIEERAAKHGANLSAGVVNDLIDLIGNNLWVLDSELQKLALYAAGKAIVRSDVKRVVSYSRENSIFSLIDAILYRRIKTAQDILHQLLDAGAEPAYILAMITRELRRMVLAKQISAGKTLPPELARELRLVDERDIRIATSKAKRYSQANLEELYRRILQTDIQIKTGKYEGQLALEILVGEICVQAPTLLR
jgi:DNA polymerase-3 subunit delta